MTSVTTAAKAELGQAPWHALAATEVLAQLESTPSGLSADDARERLRVDGPNKLPEPVRDGPLVRFLRQFNNVLIYALLVAAILAALIDHEVDALVILAVVLVNAVIGFIQEGRAESALKALSAMLQPNAAVLRDGRRHTVAAPDLVRGDVVILEAGDRVPADLRIVQARDLRIDEAVLTGESVAAEKGAEPVGTDVALGDRHSMAYSGTLVVAGIGRGVVTTVAGATELGRISAMLGRVQTLKTPLIRQMDRFGRQLTALIAALGAIVFGFAIGLRDYAMGEAFMAVIGLAVAAIPEGLPAVMTITLAIGTQRLARKNAIIRRLPAVETLGSVSVVCTDKTGTLTKNEMTAAAAALGDRSFAITGAGYAPHGSFERDAKLVDPADDLLLMELLSSGLLCNDASLRRSGEDWNVAGDPTEVALVVAAAKAGIDADFERERWPRTDTIPFDSEHRFMATLHHDHQRRGRIIVKGAPERVLPMCRRAAGDAGSVALDMGHWQGLADTLAADGKRVIAVARKDAAADHTTLAYADIDGGLECVGVFGLIDPPREEVKDAVAACHRAGIAVKMITGDHAITARAIAASLDIADPRQGQAGEAVTGAELDPLDDDAFAARARSASVFARTAPEHKLRLVTALQADGAIVAMTGDGVNDSPALKRADVGVAMGQKGSEAAKEAAEMVLADDHFATIVAAVREGRTVYDNFKKVIAWTLPTNGGEAFVIIAAIAFGLALPITPVQILWINMITAVGLGLTLAFEPTEPRTMTRRPRPPDEPLLAPMLLWRVVFVSTLFVIGSFGVFHLALADGRSLETARTLVVNVFVAMEIFYLFCARYAHGSALTWKGVKGTKAVWIGVTVVVAAQLVMTYAPFAQAVFDTRPLTIADGITIVAVGVAVFIVVEIEKAIVNHRRRGPGQPDAQPRPAGA